MTLETYLKFLDRLTPSVHIKNCKQQIYNVLNPARKEYVDIAKKKIYAIQSPLETLTPTLEQLMFHGLRHNLDFDFIRHIEFILQKVDRLNTLLGFGAVYFLSPTTQSRLTEYPPLNPYETMAIQHLYHYLAQQVGKPPILENQSKEVLLTYPRTPKFPIEEKLLMAFQEASGSESEFCIQTSQTLESQKCPKNVVVQTDKDQDDPWL